MRRNAATLPWPHALLALAVVAVWGTNFVVMKVALLQMPPLTFGTLRFVFAVLPAIFFLPRPDVPWRNLAAYGLFIGVGQFGLVYIAVSGYISPGLASLVLQTQVFFTILLSVRFHRERVRRLQWLALALAFLGIGMLLARADGETTPLGIALVLAAAASWAAGNTVARRIGRVNMLAYVVWAGLFAVPPLLALSLAFEGGSAFAAGVRHASAGVWAAVLWQSLANSLFGYAAWGWLLARHPAATITPTALLVPVFGMGASALWLGEPLPAWKLEAGVLVLCGLVLNLAWPGGTGPTAPPSASPSTARPTSARTSFPPRP